MNCNQTYFGYRRVTLADKTRRVSEVFDSVVSRYDLMNDLMSFGIHRLWKRQMVFLSELKPGQSVLDVATGTGDLAALWYQRVGQAGHVVLTDINNAMLNAGRNKLLEKGIVSGIAYVQANAEMLPFADHSFDCISIAFGLRNVADQQQALNMMFAKLRYGGHLLILEFSQTQLATLKKLYDAYSFYVIPRIGRYIAKDELSYQYLVESIRTHPDQKTLKQMVTTAGFGQVEYYNLCGGIVAIHKAYKI